MLSVASLAGVAGAFVGSLVLGWIAGRTSIAPAWTVAGFLLCGSVLLLVRLDRRREVRPSRAASPGA